MTYLSQLCSFFLIKLRPRAHFLLVFQWYFDTYSNQIIFLLCDWLDSLAEWKSEFLWLQWDAIVIPHWSHKNENIWPDRQTMEKEKDSRELKMYVLCLSVCGLTQLEDYSEDTWAETVTNSNKSPSPSFNPTSVKVMQHSSLPLPLISRFHTRHLYSRPSLIEVIQPSRCQTRGVLSLSLSSGCDSGSTLIPLPSIPSSASQPDRGLREYRCRIIIVPPLYESMEHAANITRCNTLAFAHNSPLSSYRTQKTWAEALSLDHGNVLTGEKTCEKNVTTILLTSFLSSYRMI